MAEVHAHDLTRDNSFKIEINGTNKSLNNSSTTLPNINTNDKTENNNFQGTDCTIPKYSKTSLGTLGTLSSRKGNYSWDNYDQKPSKRSGNLRRTPRSNI